VLVAVFSLLQGFLNFLVYNFRGSNGPFLWWAASLCNRMSPLSVRKKGRDSASEPEGNSPPPERASSYLPSEWFESTALRSDIDSVGDGATGVAASATGDRETSSNEQELSMNFAS
jgi:hypothetical protein